MKIEYHLSKIAWKTYHHKLRDLVIRSDIKKVCDIGGGANPLLSIEEVQKYGLEYTLLDISSEQLAKAPEGYNKLQADITDPELSIHGEYDLVCSQFLAEHVSNGLVFHKNTLNLLRDGGYAFHYFPTLYNVPFITNLILDEKISEPILLFFQPNRTKEGKHGKFKAYYDWCRGPTNKNIKKFIDLGYIVEEYIGFFGHGFYERKKMLTLLALLEEVKSQLLLKYPIPWLTQFSHILLKKNSNQTNKLN
jgi:2-polyprenyl-3-methyl-5-hydroxy-6-metoxy-1,4-benzoquinol methylase